MARKEKQGKGKQKPPAPQEQKQEQKPPVSGPSGCCGPAQTPPKA